MHTLDFTLVSIDVNDWLVWRKERRMSPTSEDTAASETSQQILIVPFYGGEVNTQEH